MKHRISRLIAKVAFATGLLASLPCAQAQSSASAVSAVSMLPLASVVVAGSATASAVAALPVALSVGGAVLTVKAVGSTMRGTVIVLERMSDGARVSIELIGASAGAASLAVGSAVTVTVVTAGVILSAAGKVIAFVANELGRALLHDERLHH